MKKVAICGAISVGKTTTLNCLENMLKEFSTPEKKEKYHVPDICFAREAAREIFTKFPELDRSSKEADFRIMSRIISNEQMVLSENRVDILVCDRSVLDVAVFARTNNADHYQDILNDRLFRSYVQTYDHFFLLDVDGVPYREDEIRKEGEDFRVGLHGGFTEVFKDLGLGYDMVSGDIFTRVTKVLNKVIELHNGVD